MRSLALLSVGFGLLIVGSSLGALVPMHGYVPNLVLPIAIFLGVSAEVPIVQGALVCFALGYLLDSFTGSPLGLQTFALVASFLIARGAGLRLFPQGRGFQILLTLTMALVSGAVVLALRAIFERAFTLELEESGTTLVRSAVATALCAPLVFLLIRRFAAGDATRRDAPRRGPTRDLERASP